MEEIVHRPWGTYETILETASYKVKRIVVHPNSQLSLQSHTHREEHWTIVAGEGTVVCGEETKTVRPGDVVNIAVGQKHRMSNFDTTDVIFIEVQLGDYLGEDDITRYEDAYGRS